MIRVLAIASLLLILAGCQFLEQLGSPTTEPLPPPQTHAPRVSPTIEIPPPRE